MLYLFFWLVEYMKIWIILNSFSESFDDNIRRIICNGFPYSGFSLVSDQSCCIYVCMHFFYCSFMFHCIDDGDIFLSAKLHVLMNNEINLNNCMILWGKLNVLIKKYNYPRK